MPDRRAVCTILAGPNGSGKSSIYDRLDPPGEYINADLIARDGAVGTIEASRQAIARLRRLQTGRRDFVFETTLSSVQSIALMRSARRNGYEIDLLFVMLSSVTLHRLRIDGRVRMGGHDIPDAVIERRYPKSLRNLVSAIPLADTCTILDNSRARPETILRIRNGRIEENGLRREQAHHLVIARTVAAALATTMDEVLDTA